MTSLLGVPIQVGDRLFGIFYLCDRRDGQPFSDEDERLLTSFATSAASAVVTARAVTSEQLRARELATEEERRRWARELHDETLQGLGALRLALASARRLSDPEAWRAAIDDAVEELDTEIANVRGIIADVRPAATVYARSGAIGYDIAGGKRVRFGPFRPRFSCPGRRPPWKSGRNSSTTASRTAPPIT